jgi:hypothetical protein
MLVFADQASQTFSRFPARSIIKIAATVAYPGHIYMAYTDGSVFTTGHKEPIIAAAGKPGDVTMAVFLVESAGTTAHSQGADGPEPPAQTQKPSAQGRQATRASDEASWPSAQPQPSA